MCLFGNIKNEIILFKALIKSINNQIDKKVKPLNNQLINQINEKILNELLIVFNNNIDSLLNRLDDNFHNILNKVYPVFENFDFSDKVLDNIRKNVNITRKIDDFVYEFSRYNKFFYELTDIILIIDQLFELNDNKDYKKLSDQIALSFSIIYTMINSLKYYVFLISKDIRKEKNKLPKSI